VAVANLVSRVNNSPEIIAAALLHDVVEDTPITLEQIDREFGSKVSQLVFWLTDTELKEGNRKTRNALDRQRIAKAPADAQTIKLADLIHNTSSIVDHDRQFARVYLREKADLLAVLVKGDDFLYGLAIALLEDSKLKLHG